VLRRVIVRKEKKVTDREKEKMKSFVNCMFRQIL
jgi:hypothetical protein